MTELERGSMIAAISQLIKPELPIAAGVCVVTGEVLALGGLPELTLAILGFFVGFFLSAAAMASNDYFDVEVDQVNYPDRPLPSGRVTKDEVIVISAVLTSIGLIFAAILGLARFLIALVTWAIGLLYNWRFKEAGLPGNMMVSFSVAITFLFGGVAAGGLQSGVVWVFAVLAFIFDLGEEIINGVLDAEGDKKRNSRSIALTKGRRYALALAGLLFATFISISYIPYLAGWLGLPI